MIALFGENGAGKTNLLEALSLFSPGRGLRRAELAECARRGGAGGFAVSVEVETDGVATQLGHGLTPSGERLFRVDRMPVSSARAFADHVRVLWLTPAMDGLFSGAAGERRRFLDRLALGVDAEHGARANRLERALRNRNRLLEEGVADRRWLDAAEQEIAALGVAVAAARRETVSRLVALIAAGRDDASPFPWAEVTIEGELERRLALEPALAVEEWYRGELAASRRRDAAAGRTLIGGGSGLFDRRAESPADGADSGPCEADQRHDRTCANSSSRRDRRAFRRQAPGGSLRRTAGAWRPGLDDRRRPRLICARAIVRRAYACHARMRHPCLRVRRVGSAGYNLRYIDEKFTRIT
ncbi:MAG: hypothetical protein FD172_262 [Methylocystaceae bacterium]|nr:MAG: hypothetical protein FD172_262 [Methylocystaceae bacterium]